uniref:hypothetical protein n=1 Tax=Cupriavidus taiwanensis TaxID=164546 RepID=UPI0011C06C5B|nr:hypothetical protein [Cupriavidus taiwanensis]
MMTKETVGTLLTACVAVAYFLPGPISVSMILFASVMARLPGVPGSVTRDAPLQRRYRIAGALVQAGERIAENGIVIASSPRFLRPSYYGKAARRCTASCHCLAAMAK